MQNYRIPSRAECIACHTPQAGHALSINTRQLNRTEDIHGFSGNQLTLLQSAGYFSNAPVSPNLLPRHFRADETAFPVEARVRSYLAVNCANCHQAGGTAPASWDARAHLTLASTASPSPTASRACRRSAATNSTPPPSRCSTSGSPLRFPPARLTRNGGRRTSARPTRRKAPPRSTPTRTVRPTNLANTSPLDGGALFLPQLAAPGDSFSLTATLPANRSFQIETSTDLAAWTLWNVPGNAGLPTPGGP